MKKFAFIGMILALLTLGVAPTVVVAKEPVKIGVMAPITGQWASEGQDMVNIIELLVEEHNKAGGTQIVLEVADDGGNPKTASLAAQKLISNGVLAVIGTYGSAVTEATQDIYADDGIVQIGTGSTSIRLSEKGFPLFFRTSPRDDDQGRVLAEHVGKLGFKKVALVHDNSSYAKGLAQEIKPQFEKAGQEVVFYDAITPGDRDYSVTLTKLKSLNPEIIVFTGYYPEAGMLLRQKKDMGWDVPMIGGDATNNQALVKIAGPAATGYYFISPPGPADLTDEASLAFMTEYKKRHGNLPSSVWSVMAGDAFKVLAKAVDNIPNPTSENIGKYLHDDLKGFTGFTGPVAFNAKGDRVGDVYRLYQVNEAGVFTLVP